MLKKIAIFITLVISTGMALSLYLPSYVPKNSVQATFRVNNLSLRQAVNSEDMQLSRLLNGVAEKTIQYGLQLSFYGSLAAAKAGAKQLSTRELNLPVLPTIFKVKEQQREWYAILLGPFDSASENNTRRQQLDKHDLLMTTVLWPATDDAMAGNKK